MMLYKIKEPIYICGDLHGNFHWLVPYLERVGLSNCSIIFCGDVGLGFKPLKLWHQWLQDLKLPEFLRKQKIDCYFVRGNHDDPAWFDDKTLQSKHLKAVSDYSVLSSPSHNILCVGGGISIDRKDRQFQMEMARLRYSSFYPDSSEAEVEANVTPIYWPNEAPVYNESAIDSLECQIDTVCSHVAPIEFSPTTLPDKYWLQKDFRLGIDCMAERRAMSDVLTRLQHNQHPLTKWFYGHYHFYDTKWVNGIATNVLDMARDGTLSLKELTI